LNADWIDFLESLNAHNVEYTLSTQDPKVLTNLDSWGPGKP